MSKNLKSLETLSRAGSSPAPGTRNIILIINRFLVQYANIFLDRDGTIIEDRHYLSSPDQIVFLPGVVQTLQAMQAEGCSLFLVTNQSGIGRGYFSMAQYYRVHEALLGMLAEQGIYLTDVSFCPHAPEAGCSCRKPGTGMWETISIRHGLKANQSVMIGDKQEDIAFGRNCGFTASILLGTGKGRDFIARMGLKPCSSKWIEPSDQGLPGMPAVSARDLPAAWQWLQHRYS